MELFFIEPQLRFLMPELYFFLSVYRTKIIMRAFDFYSCTFLEFLEVLAQANTCLNDFLPYQIQRI